MLSAPLIPVAEAAIFTLGCAVIQAQRHRAQRLTEVLAALAFVAVLGVLFLAMPRDQLNMATTATAMADMGESSPTPPR